MKIKNLIEGLNAQQRSVPQLPAQARARKISVLGAKTDPKHPFAGYAVGADESAEPGRKRIGPDRNDPWEQGWRAGFRQNEFNPYPAGSKEARQWDDGYAEARAQPNHYDEGVAEGVTEAGRKQPGQPKFTAYPSYHAWRLELMRRGDDQIDHLDNDYVDNYRVLFAVDRNRRVVGMYYRTADTGTFVPPGKGFSDMIYYADTDPHWPYSDDDGKEDLRELSKDTLGSYAKKSADDLDISSYMAGKGGEDEDYLKSMKRKEGIKKAINRLTVQQTQKKKKGVTEAGLKGLSKELDQYGNPVNLAQVSRAARAARAAHEQAVRQANIRLRSLVKDVAQDKFNARTIFSQSRPGGRVTVTFALDSTPNYTVDAELNRAVGEEMARLGYDYRLTDGGWLSLRVPVKPVTEGLDPETYRSIARAIEGYKAQNGGDAPAGEDLFDLADDYNTDVDTVLDIINGKIKFNGIAERRAQPRHYDEGVVESKEELHAQLQSINQQLKLMKYPPVGRPNSISYVQRRKELMKQKEQILAQLKQGVAEGRAGVDDTDTVGFSVNSEAAYMAVMDRYGDSIDHDETSGIMYIPAKMWPNVEMVAFDADGEGATRDDGISEIEETNEGIFDVFKKKPAAQPAATDAAVRADQDARLRAMSRSVGGGSWKVGDVVQINLRTAQNSNDSQFASNPQLRGLNNVAGKIVKVTPWPQGRTEMATIQVSTRQGQPYTFQWPINSQHLSKYVAPAAVKEGERNEMDTPAVQAALRKMAERHKGEKWTKEQLAALGKRIAARGQKPVKEGDTVKTPTGLIHKGKYGTSYYDPKNRNEPGTNRVGRPVKSTGRDVSIDEPRQIRRNQPGYMEKTPRITNPDAPRSPVRKTGPIAGGGLDIDLPKHVQDRIFAQSEFDRFKSNPGIVRVKPKDDGVAILDLDETSRNDVEEGWKSKLAGAALAGAAALGGGAAAAHDHGDYGHYDQRVDNPSWDTAGYDSHIKSNTNLTKTTTTQPGSAPQVKRDSQRRISDVTGPNAQGEYRVWVGLNGKTISSYVTKTPPQNWMVKEDVTKEDIITKLKARLGDYLSDISKEIKKDPDLIDKLAARAPGDQMGPPVKTVTTDDGHQIQIHGNEDDGFRISIKNKQAPSRFNNLDEAVMACEMYCARRRKQALNADYVEEA